jgi:hypothetical protein
MEFCSQSDTARVDCYSLWFGDHCVRLSSVLSSFSTFVGTGTGNRGNVEFTSANGIPFDTSASGFFFSTTAENNGLRAFMATCCIGTTLLAREKLA